MSTRATCTRPGCGREMLVSTAEKTGGLCMPCWQTEEAKKRDAYVRTHRRDVDRFAGVTDPADVLLILEQSVPHDPLANLLPPPATQEELYAALDTQGEQRLVAHAVDMLAAEDDSNAVMLGERLVCFRSADVEPLLEAILETGALTRGVIFRGASPRIRDRIIRTLENKSGDGSDPVQSFELLRSLAWIGDEVVVDRFARWRSDPPVWKADVGIAPEDYALEAGWELTENGTRRDLFNSECHALIPKRLDSGDSVRVAVPTSGTCPWCSKALTALFDVDLEAQALQWIGKPDPPRMVLTTCTTCTCFGTIYSHTDGREERWHAANAISPYRPADVSDWGSLPGDTLSLAPTRRLPHYAASQFLPTRFSQIGGHPTWVQHAEYPMCPTCARRMVFLAQFSEQDINWGDGMYYAFHCRECRVGATGFQQS